MSQQTTGHVSKIQDLWFVIGFFQQVIRDIIICNVILVSILELWTIKSKPVLDVFFGVKDLYVKQKTFFLTNIEKTNICTIWKCE